MRIATLTCLLLAGPVLAQDRVGIKMNKDAIEFTASGQLVAKYLIDPKWSKPILWPVKAPGGVTITRGWPIEPFMEGGSKDHVHQKSAWFCHGDVIPEGLELKQTIKNVKGVDFWSEAKGHGKIVCIKVGEPKTQGFGGLLPTMNEWRTADGTKIMDETRVVRLYDFGKAWLIVFDIDLVASVCPITFGDTKEGCFAVRVHDDIRANPWRVPLVWQGNGTIENAAGKQGEKPCRTTRSAWMDYSGLLDGKRVGLAIFDDPKNPHPVFWHVRSYGLMAANPFARKQSEVPGDKERPLVRLEKGEHLRLRYGILLHEGDAQSGRVAGYFDRFVKLRDRE